MPPVLRQPKELGWMNSLSQPLQINNDIFLDYLTGSTYSLFNSGNTYVAKDRIIYADKAIYENLTGSTNIYPTDANTWLKINSNYIGAKERMYYNARKLDFEFALNRWFQLSGFCPNILYTAITQSLFCQSANTIYIQNLTGTSNAFIMGQSGIYSSVLVSDSNFAQNFMVNNYIATLAQDFTIWIPNYIYSAFSQTTFSQFADSLNLGGMSYSLSGY